MSETRRPPMDQKTMDEALKTRTLSDAEILKAGGEYQKGQLHVPKHMIEQARKEMDETYESAETKQKLDAFFVQMEKALYDFDVNVEVVSNKKERMEHQERMGAFRRLGTILSWSDEIRKFINNKYEGGYCCLYDDLDRLPIKIMPGDKPTKQGEPVTKRDVRNALAGVVSKFLEAPFPQNGLAESPLLLGEIKALLEVYEKEIILTGEARKEENDIPANNLLTFAKKIAKALDIPAPQVQLDFRHRIIEPAKAARKKIDNEEKV